MVILRNIKKTYWLTKENQVASLRGIDLEIKAGEFVALIGPSGSGKSTLLNIMGLLDAPDQGGCIQIAQQDITKLKGKSIAELRSKTLGFVFQTFNLLPRLSAIDNVILPMRYAKVPRQERFKRARLLLDKMGLAKRIYHKPPELSGGERQRVAIARALANNPKIIFADEPTGNLDSKAGAEVMDILKELNKKEGVTLVLVTHDLELAKLADRIIKIKDGKLC